MSNQTATLVAFLTPELLRLIEAAPDAAAPPPMPVSTNTLSASTGFPSAYRAEWPRPLDAAWQWAHQRGIEAIRAGRWIALLGPRGTGKTQLAAELARDFSRAGTRYATAHALYLRILRTRDRNATEHEADVIEEMQTARLLVLDETQEKYGTDAEDRKLTAILDRRYGDRLPVILISNHTARDFLASLSESVFSRFQELGSLVELTGPSHRVKRTNAEMRDDMGGKRL